MTDDKIEAWLVKKEKLYTSVIPGVMDSGELEDMRKLLALVRVYREDYEFYWRHFHHCLYHHNSSDGVNHEMRRLLKIHDAEAKAKEIVKND